MYKQTKLNKALVYAIIIPLQLNSITVYAANIIVANDNTTINNSNKAPIVNIAQPNSNGLSHNKYTEFNVSNPGLVLNNSTIAVNATLAGNIAGNPNLGGRPAGIILNEVVGRNSSQLHGQIQIAGQQATLIIANPNGINASGVGFINTNRVVMTTGAPILDTSNNIQGFNIANDSKIVFTDNAGGYAMSKTPRADILSRAVEVNGTIQAEQLNIITGSNKVAYDDLRTEKINGTGNAPTIALDVGALGGMYANRITMVGTETGVGVNSKGIIQTAGANSSLSLSIDGKITIAQSIDTHTPSGETPAMIGGIYSQGTLGIQSSQLENNAELVAGDNININSAKISNNGSIAGGIYYPTPDENIQDLLDPLKTAATTIHITTDRINNTGEIYNEQGTINLNATGQIINSANINAHKLTISANQLDNTSGNIEQTSNTDTLINIADTVSNNTGNIRTAGILSMSAKQLDNTAGYINGDSGLHILANDITNINKGVLTSQAASTSISTDKLNNSDGLIKATTDLELIGSSNLEIAGNITAGKDIKINSSGDIVQSANAVIRASNDLIINALGDINNDGSNLVQGNLTWNAKNATNNITGRIFAQGAANINTAGTFVNNGKLTGSNVMPPTPTPDQLPNYISPDKGQSTTETAAGSFGGLEADANTNNNNKPIIEKTDSGIDIVQIATANSKGVSLNNYTRFDVATSGLILNNSTQHSLTKLAGYVDANYRIGLRPATVIVNQVTSTNPSKLRGYIEVAGHKSSVVIANPNGIAVDNLGFINTNRATLVTGQTNINGILNNYQLTDGNINITGKGLSAIDTSRLDIIAKDVSISGGIWADSVHVIAGSNTVSADGLAITSTNAIANNPYGIDLSSTGSLTANNIQLTTTDYGSGVKNFGQLLTTNGNMEINSKNKLAQHGTLHSAKNLTINSGNDLYLSGTTQADANLTIYSARQLLNTGHIGIKNGKLSLGALSDIIQAGDVRSEQGNMTLYSQSNLSQYGNITIKKGAAEINTAADSNQYGTIIAAEDINWQAGGVVRNIGDIQSQGNIKVTADIDFRQFGNIIAEQDLTIDSGRDSWNGKNMVAKTGNITMTSTQDLLNTGTINAHDTINITADNITQTTATIIGGKQTTINTNTLTNDKSIIFSGANIDLNAQNKLENINSAMIYSQGDINIQGMGNTATALLRNQSSSIRADHDLKIQAQQIINEKREFITGWDVTESNHEIPLPGFSPHGDNYDAKRFYHRVVQDGAIYIDSPAAYLLAGNDINITADKVTNEYSFITAGQNMDITANGLSNLSYKNIKITTDTGNNVIYWKYNVHRRFHLGCYTRYGQTVYPHYNQTRQNIAGGADSVISAGNQLHTNISTTTTNKLLDAAGDLVTTGYTATAQNPTTTAPIGNIPSISDLTNDNLLIRPADITAKYLYEMDTRFTGYKNFLSSDYLLNRILTDPNKVGKRIGDGYVEQELIRKQLLEKTGRQYLGDYRNMEDTYKALMNNAAVYADEFSLIPGIALSAEQMAKLTNDIVWFETKEIDGQQVLVPVVYLASNSAIELKANGALITGKVLELNSGEFSNSGNILAQDNLAINANSIQNKYGSIEASKDIQLTAKQDLHNTSGNITGNNVTMTAGRDINLATETTTTQYRGLTKTTQGNTAQVIAKGNLNINAASNINLQGALATAEGAVHATAGNDINLRTVQTGSSVSTAGSGYSYTEDNTRHQGSAIGGKDLSVKATGDLNISGSHLAADNNINIIVGKDMNLSNVKDNSLLDTSIGERGGHKFTREMNYDEQIKGSSISAGADINIKNQGDSNIRSSNILSEKGTIDISTQGKISISADQEIHNNIKEAQYTNVGILSSKKTEIYDETYSNTNIGSNISGDKVNIVSNKDLNITASNVVAEQDIKLNAAGDININSSTDEYGSIYNRREKTTGIFASGGIGFTIGSKEQKDKYSSAAQMQTGSTIGSIQGTVDINAGKNANIQGSDIMADKNINISGQNVKILDSLDRYTNAESHEFKQTGLTVSLGGKTIDAIKKVTDPLQRATEVSDDRLKALYVAKAAQEWKSSLTELKEVRSDKPGLSINVSFGMSKSSNSMDNIATVSQGSKLTAGEDINITSREQDITIKGSDLHGENIHLTAKENIHILAGENSSATTTKSESKSASIGVEIGLGKITTVGITASGSLSREDGQENIITHTPSTITANKELNINSGQGTNIIGSQVAGDKVTADIGGNLKIESLQDTVNYQADSKHVGISVSTSGIQGSAGVGEVDSDYRSVSDQAGIYAGDQGFDITVGKNTDLKGAVIDSNATADKNKLDTGTITFSDIKNQAEYSAGNIGVNVDTRKDTEKKDAGVTPNIGIASKDDAESTTKSGVTAGEIKVRDTENQQQDINTLHRDTKNTLNELQQIFDKKTVQEKQELAKVFSEVAHKQVGTLIGKISLEEKAALNVIVGGITAQLGGGSFLSGAAGSLITELVQEELNKIQDPASKQIVVGVLGAVISGILTGDAQTGASTAINTEKYNHLPHEFQESLSRELQQAESNEKKSAIIDKYMLISAAFIATDPQMAEDMEKSIMLELANLTKFDGAGVSFIVDPNQGLHNNLIASRDFFNTYHVVKHLPNVFITGTMMTAAAVTAPIAVVSNTITYGGTIYTLVKDYQKADGNMELFKQNIAIEGGKAFVLTTIDTVTGGKSTVFIILGKSGLSVFADAILKD